MLGGRIAIRETIEGGCRVVADEIKPPERTDRDISKESLAGLTINSSGRILATVDQEAACAPSFDGA
jgi:hypothetical protein